MNYVPPEKWIGYGLDWDNNVVEIMMPKFDAMLQRRMMVYRWCPWMRGMIRVEQYRAAWGFVPRQKEGLREFLAA